MLWQLQCINVQVSRSIRVLKRDKVAYHLIDTLELHNQQCLKALCCLCYGVRCWPQVQNLKSVAKSNSILISGILLNAHTHRMEKCNLYEVYLSVKVWIEKNVWGFKIPVDNGRIAVFMKVFQSSVVITKKCQKKICRNDGLWIKNKPCNIESNFYADIPG